MKQIVYLLIVLNQFLLVYCDWIDPHDMDIRVNVPQKNSQNAKNPDLYKSCEIQSFKENNVNCNVYLKRVVGLIVNSAILEKDNGVYTGQIKINIAEEDFNFLKSFTSHAEMDMNVLQRLDSTLSEAFKKTMNDYFMETRNQLLFMLLSETTVHIICLTSMLVLIYLMFKANFSLWYIVKYLLFVAWLYDSFVKYINLREEYDRHNLKLMSNKCNVSSGSWTDTWNYIFVNLPWGLNIILMPLMLVFIGVIFCTCFAFVTDVPIKLNLMHLFQLQFGDKSKNNNGNVITENTLNKVIDACSQKPAIQLGGQKQDKNAKRKKKDKNHSQPKDLDRIEDVKEKKCDKEEKTLAIKEKSQKNSENIGDSIENKKNIDIKHVVTESGDC